MLILMGRFMFLSRENLVKRVLLQTLANPFLLTSFHLCAESKTPLGHRYLFTIDKMTTHGRFREDTISTASDVLPDPEPPAMPMMLVSAHGGE